MSWIILWQVSDWVPYENYIVKISALWIISPSMIVSVIDVMDWVTTVGVNDPPIVIVKVLFSVLHSVKTLALTISFWWIVGVWNPKVTALFVRFLNSITYWPYRNEANTFPFVDYVIPLYVTLFKMELPRTVFLLTVNKVWALFVEIIEHVPSVCPTEKGR